MPAALGDAHHHGVYDRGDKKPQRHHASRALGRGKFVFEHLDHLSRVEIAMPHWERSQRESIETGRHYFGPPRIFWARATSSSARIRSDSARATARPKLVRL